MAMVTMVSKVKSEKGTAKGSLAHDNTSEHQEPPRLYLEHHHLEKLLPKGSKMPQVGSKIHVHGLVHVGSVSEDTSHAPSGGKAKGGEGNTKRSMTLHFHKMEMGRDEKDHEESQKAGMKGAIDKALSKGAGSESADDAEND